MSSEIIVQAIFKDYLKPITYFSALAKIFGPQLFLFAMYIINNMIASQPSSQPTQLLVS